MCAYVLASMESRKTQSKLNESLTEKMGIEEGRSGPNETQAKLSWIPGVAITRLLQYMVTRLSMCICRWSCCLNDCIFRLAAGLVGCVAGAIHLVVLPIGFILYSSDCHLCRYAVVCLSFVSVNSASLQLYMALCSPVWGSSWLVQFPSCFHCFQLVCCHFQFDLCGH